ncbi:TPA: hypothetical protein N0F65_003125 [Lagenidium giganteum]|uniref:RWP-RK domain-containing protein n=1 Tax=Lagenidium giganteum TaxID=4803 RepID=A0AAV2YXI2_9STRA|nr:TPA: hypothetical protein N0F65_003125 [Lagenidium giganteum]
MKLSPHNKTPAKAIDEVDMRRCIWPSRPQPQQRLKARRPSRRLYDFSYEQLSKYFDMPQVLAAKCLGVAPITIKRVCKRLGFRWPYAEQKRRLLHEERRSALKEAEAAVWSGSEGDEDQQSDECPSTLPKPWQMTPAGLAFHRLPVDCLGNDVHSS